MMQISDEVGKEQMYQALKPELLKRELGILNDKYAAGSDTEWYIAAVTELSALFELLDTFDKLVEWNESLNQ